MRRMILTLLLKDVPRLRIATLLTTLKSLGADVEQTLFMGSHTTKDTVLIECILESVVEKQLASSGYEVTRERVDYIVRNLMNGDKFNAPFVDMLNEYVNNAVIDKKIELEGLQYESVS